MAQKYATVDAGGMVTAFYSSDINPTIPPGAIAISDAQWQQWVADTQGLRWAGSALEAYTAPPVAPMPAQQAQAALYAGLTIASTGTPAIDGTFAIDPATQGRIAAVEVYILKNGTFPGPATSLKWPTIAGAAVTFPGTAVFQGWATAIADYVSALDLIISVDSGALPAAAVTIA